MLKAPQMQPKWSWRNLRKSHHLKNSSLVIDGQNFFYRLYKESELPYQFGAEANEYAKLIRKQQQKYKDVHIDNYIIFKGGDTEIEKKISKLWLTTFDFKSDDNFVAPIFMKEIHHQVLDEMGVKYATSVMESKDDCVALANVLQCPVVSEQKMYIYKGVGCIPYTTIDYTSNHDLPCELYHLKEFFDSDKKVAIFLALTDATVFPQDYLEKLMKKLDVKKWYDNQKTQEILIWLSDHTESDAITSITEIFSTESDKDKFLSQIEVLQKKQYDKGSVVVRHLLLQNTCNDSSLCAPLSLPVTPLDPQWFEKGVATQKIAIPYINMYKHKCIMGSWALEKNDNCEDSLMLSIDIIKYAYNLLTNFKHSEIIVYQTSDKFIKVNTALFFEKPKYQCTESVFENGWNDIKPLKLFEHFLIKNKINQDIINEVSAEARLLYIALTYFAHKKASKHIQVTKEVYCFIVSYVMLNVIFDERESFRKKDNNISESDCDAATSVTTKYFSYSKSEAKEIFDENTLKTLVELQYCLLHMNYLNALCGSSFVTTKYHRTFNGTFIYKLLIAMGDRDALKFNEELFETAPSVLEFVNTLFNTFLKLL